MYVRKAQRACNAVSNTRYGAAIRKAMMAFHGPRFEIDADGRKIRLWGDGYEDWVTDDDVRAWLVGLRVVEDLRDGLEFVRQSYIDKMVKDDMLRKVGPHWWITRKCADRFKLPKVMGCDFPK